MLVSETHKKLVLNLSNPGKVTATIPTAKLFSHNGEQLVAVPHRDAETRVLRSMGINAPAPISSYYNWPGQYKPFHAQQVTSAFLTQNKKAFVLNDMGCVDSETEYLSEAGWVKISDYTAGKVAQFHPDTGRIEFVEPTKYVKLPCADMVRVKTKYGVDQLLSPEHRVLLFAKGNPAKREVIQAATLLERQDKWLTSGSNKGKLTEIGWTQAAIPTVFSASGEVGVDLTDADLRVQIAVIADGHFPNKSRTCVVRLKKTRKIERLRKLLDTAGITYREMESTAASAQGFHIFSFQAPLRLKEFDARFWSATQQQLVVFTDEVLHWDGSVSDRKPSARFSTTIKASADFVQYAFAATGRTARVLYDPRGCYEVIIRQCGKPLQLCSVGSDGGKNRVMWPEPSTDGFKYCFMVPSTFLLFRRNGCIFASGNTGKTLATLWAYDYLRSTGQANKALIISPLSTLERTWADEVFKHFPHLSVAVLHGTKDRRLKLLAGDFDIYLINHDGVKTIEQELVAKTEIDAVVVDEIASFRNASTARWKSLRKVTANRDYLWGLTGTPIPNSPTDAWAQCKLISPDRVPGFFGRFKDATMRQVGPFKWEAREGAMSVVADAMQPAIRFSRDECVDLPPCQYVTRSAPLSPEQLKAFKEMQQKLTTEFSGSEATAVNEAVKISKLVQIASGVFYDVNGDDVVLPSQGRLDVAKEIIEQAGSKVIIFVPYKGALRAVAAELSKDFTVECISGDTPAAQRADIFGRFQSTPDPRVIVAQPAAMSHGLTLTAASVVVWYAPPTSNEIYQQANARITRPGQKLNQLIVNIGSTPLEAKMYTRLEKKQTLQGVLLDSI